MSEMSEAEISKLLHDSPPIEFERLLELAEGANMAAANEAIWGVGNLPMHPHDIPEFQRFRFAARRLCHSFEEYAAFIGRYAALINLASKCEWFEDGQLQMPVEAEEMVSRGKCVNMQFDPEEVKAVLDRVDTDE